MSTVSLNTLQETLNLLLYLHDEDGGDSPDLRDLILVDPIEDLVIQRENVFQLIVRNTRLNDKG